MRTGTKSAAPDSSVKNKGDKNSGEALGALFENFTKKNHKTFSNG